MIEPFTAKIPDADLTDLQRRLADTRWAPEQPAGTEDGAYGVPLSRLRRMVARWQEFDWRAWEDRLNAYPQFLTEIDGQPVHFLHVRSAAPVRSPSCSATGGQDRSSSTSTSSAGSSTRPRTEPIRPTRSTWCSRRFPATASPVRRCEPGWGTRRIAAAWAELMARLGYERYGAIGNDAGSMISPELGRQAARARGRGTRHAAVQLPQRGPGGTRRPGRGRAGGACRSCSGSGSTRARSTCCRASSRRPLPTRSRILRPGSSAGTPSCSTRALTTTSSSPTSASTGSPARRARRSATTTKTPTSPPPAQAGPTTVPIGLAAAADGDFRSIRRFAERDHARITSWTELPGVTGHYSAHTNPDQLAGDIRRFFRPLRPATGPPPPRRTDRHVREHLERHHRLPRPAARRRRC